jgi:hypothetical protein
MRTSGNSVERILPVLPYHEMAGERREVDHKYAYEIRLDWCHSTYKKKARKKANSIFPHVYIEILSAFSLASLASSSALACPVELADQGTGQRDCREKHHEDNRDVKDQLFYSTACFEGCARAGGAAEGATQASAAYLEKYETNDGYAQNNLNDANGRKPR